MLAGGCGTRNYYPAKQLARLQLVSTVSLHDTTHYINIIAIEFWYPTMPACISISSNTHTHSEAEHFRVGPNKSVMTLAVLKLAVQEIKIN